MRVGFTGTSKGMNIDQLICVRTLLGRFWQPDYAHHGDCVGADSQFHSLCEAFSRPTRIVIHPPKDSKARAFRPSMFSRRPKDYLERNRDIVDACDVLLATPKGKEIQRSGTWSTIRYARKLGKPIIILMP